MDSELLTAQEVILKYRGDVEKLSAYIPWLIEKSGQKVARDYKQDDVGKTTMPFPVYDSMLLRFIQDAKETVFMDRNYVYVYSRFRIKNYLDEINVIHQCTLLQMDILGGILSKYVLGGQTKARLWSDGVVDGVFLEVVQKAKELIDFWDTRDKK